VANFVNGEPKMRTGVTVETPMGDGWEEFSSPMLNVAGSGEPDATKWVTACSNGDMWAITESS
jgi:hypothetical protein